MCSCRSNTNASCICFAIPSWQKINTLHALCSLLNSFLHVSQLSSTLKVSFTVFALAATKEHATTAKRINFFMFIIVLLMNNIGILQCHLKYFCSLFIVEFGLNNYLFIIEGLPSNCALASIANTPLVTISSPSASPSVTI